MQVYVFRIGLGISKKLESEGAKVVISSRKASNVEDALSNFKNAENVHGVVCHVAKAEDRDKLINETVAKFGAIDILVSNAATNPVFGPMLEVNERFLKYVTFDGIKKDSFLRYRDLLEVRRHIFWGRG